MLCGSVDGRVGLSVVLSITLVQTEIFQLSDGLMLNWLQTFMMNSTDFDDLLTFRSSATMRLTSVGWIAMKFGSDMHVPGITFSSTTSRSCFHSVFYFSL